jgi:hypothetical protein
MSFRKPAWAATGLLFFTFTMLAQNASFEGYVKAADGKPVASALVKILRYDVKREFQVKTDMEGHYIYAGLPSGGFFTILVQVDGKDAAAITGVKSQPGGPLKISFNLGATPEEQLRSVQQDIRRLGGNGHILKSFPFSGFRLHPRRIPGKGHAVCPPSKRRRRRRKPLSASPRWSNAVS